MIGELDSRVTVFGVGCFSFEAPTADLLTMQNPQGKYSIHDWAKDVRRFLEEIPSIDEIRVEDFRFGRGDRPAGWRDSIVEVVQSLDPDGIHRGGSLRPHPSSGRVSFVVTIPVRTQREVMYLAEGRSGTKFDVDIVYGFGMPVAFVRSYADLDNPSLAVAIVREFILREADSRSRDDNPIRFVCMGSSPIWSNFAIRWALPEQEKEIVFEHVDGQGYSWKVFYAKKPSGTDCVDKVYAALMARLCNAAGTYYELVSERLVLEHAKEFIELELEELVGANRNSGLLSWWKRLRGGGRKANSLLIEIHAAQLGQERSSSRSLSLWERDKDQIGSAVLDEHFSRELGESNKDYLDNTKSVVDLLNSRYSRDVEMFSIVLASVLGGAVGAILTALSGLAVGG